MTVVILLCIRALSVKFYVLVNVRFPICIKTDLRTLCTFVPTRAYRKCQPNLKGNETAMNATAISCRDVVEREQYEFSQLVTRI